MILPLILCVFYFSLLSVILCFLSSFLFVYPQTPLRFCFFLFFLYYFLSVFFSLFFFCPPFLSSSRSQHIDQVQSVIALHSGKVIEKPTLEPCEKDDKSISEGKEEVKLEHCKKKTDSPPVLPFTHAMTKQREVNHIRNICVFGESSLGKEKEFLESAYHLGRVLAEQKIHLVYGGGNLGLMRGVSIAAFLGGSQVLGVIPTALAEGDIIGKTIEEELQVSTMSERLSECLTMLMPLLLYQVVWAL